MNVARATALFFLGVLSTATAGAFVWIVPGIANTTGLNGEQYWSDLTLSNPGTSSLTVTVSAIPGAGTAVAEPGSYTIAPGSTIGVGIAQMFRGTGALRIEADSRTVIFARTYQLLLTLLPFYGGTSLPVIQESELLAAQEEGHSAWVQQSSEPGQSLRTNVAVVFPDPGGGTAAVTLYGENGTALGTLAFDSSSPGFLQRPLAAFGVTSLPVGRIAIRVTRGRACGYTGLADGSSWDVSILAAEPLPPAASPPGMVDLMSLGIAQTPGQRGSLWQTDARLANPGPNAVPVNAYLLGGEGATAGASSFSVSAGQTMAIRNLVQSLFNVSDAFAGAVLWRAAAPLAIATFTREVGRGGMTGASHNAVPLERFSRSDDVSPDVTELRSGFDYRTNLLVVAGPEGTTFDLDAFERDGRLRTTVHQALRPLASGIFSLATLFPGLPEPGRVRIRVASGSLHVDLGVLGNNGGDLVFQEASPRGSGIRSKLPIAVGTWGGAPNGMDHLSVDSTSIQLFRNCQTGNFPQPLRLDGEGRFAVLGTYSVSVGPGISFDAILSGQLNGGTVTLRVLPLGSSFGVDTNPETLAFGAPFQPFNGVCPIEY